MMQEARYTYKSKARAQLVGKYSSVIPITLIFGLITFGISQISAELFGPTYEYVFTPFLHREMIDPGQPAIVFLFDVLLFVVGAVILYSTTQMYIQTADNEKPVIEEILVVGIKEEPVRSITLQFLITLFTILWTFLFIIPGIVKSYAYSMSFYLLFRQPNLSATEAIEESKKITDGHKMDLFILDLSYIGWYILGIFTLGILWFWIVPQHATARTLYFKEIYDNLYATKNVFEEDTELNE